MEDQQYEGPEVNEEEMVSHICLKMAEAGHAIDPEAVKLILTFELDYLEEIGLVEPAEDQ